MDPVDIGMRLHTVIMETIAPLVSSEQELTVIARMIDAFAASLQVRAAEHGLDGPPDVIRQVIKEKLQSLGMMPVKEERPVEVGAFSSEEPCLCIKDEDGECLSCKKSLAEYGTEFSEIQASYLSQIDKIGGLHGRVPCQACVLKYTDLAMSEIFMTVGSALPSEQQNVAMAMYAAFYQVYAGMGVQAAPMLDKAWKELKEKKGWI